TLVVLVFTLGLLIEGYTHGILGENAASEPVAGARTPGPAAVLAGGPVVAPAGGPRGGPVSYRIPPKTAVLSFDDGPDPTWTPKIIAVLRRYHVPGTFFMIGARAADNPQIGRASCRERGEISGGAG